MHLNTIFTNFTTTNQKTKNQKPNKMKEFSKGDLEGIQRPLPETGLQVARCYGIAFLGTLPSKFKGAPVLGKDGKQVYAPEITFFWELPNTTYVWKEGEPEEPVTLFYTYSVSAGAKAKLPDVLKSWGSLPKRPEVIGPQLIDRYKGQLCMINVEHSQDGKYANVGGSGRAVNPFMKGLPIPKPMKEQFFFDVENFDWNLFNALPKFIQDKIKDSKEFANVTDMPNVSSLVPDDDLPF